MHRLLLSGGSLRGGRPTDAPESRPSQEGTRAHWPACLSCACSLIGLSGPAPGQAGPVHAREGSSSFTHLSLEGPRDAQHSADVTHSTQDWTPPRGNGAPVSAQTGRAPSAHSAGRGSSRETQAAGQRTKGRHSPPSTRFQAGPSNCQQPLGESGGRAADEKQQAAWPRQRC